MAAVSTLADPNLDIGYEAELKEKVRFIKEEFKFCPDKEPTIFKSPEKYFRFRTAINVATNTPVLLSQKDKQKLRSEFMQHKDQDRFGEDMTNLVTQGLIKAAGEGITNNHFVLIKIRDENSNMHKENFSIMAMHPKRMPLETLSQSIFQLTINPKFCNILGERYAGLGLNCVKFHSVMKHEGIEFKMEEVKFSKCVSCDGPDDDKGENTCNDGGIRYNTNMNYGGKNTPIAKILVLLVFETPNTWEEIDLSVIGDVFPEVCFVASAKKLSKTYHAEGERFKGSSLPTPSDSDEEVKGAESSKRKSAEISPSSSSKDEVSPKNNSDEENNDNTEDTTTQNNPIQNPRPVLINRKNKKNEPIQQPVVIEETLKIANRSCHYKQVLGNFANPNAYMAIHTGNWLHSVIEKLKNSQNAENSSTISDFNLLEIYCGVGSHTVALGHLFDKIVAVEINSKLVEQLEDNIKRNNLTEKVIPVRAPSEKFCKKIMKSRKYENLEFSWILVDPPREGLDATTVDLVKNFPHILYISCNPLALRRDLDLLKEFEVAEWCVLDHFPFTPHVECGVYLRRKDV